MEKGGFVEDNSTENKKATGMDTNKKDITSKEMFLFINQHYYKLIQKGIDNLTTAEIETVEKYITLIQHLIASRKEQDDFIKEVEKFCGKGESVKWVNQI